MSKRAASAEVRVGPKGRIVIPASIRDALGVVPGSRLVIRQDGGSIVLEPRERLLERMRTRYAKVQDGISLADELIAERRAEAAQEAER